LIDGISVNDNPGLKFAMNHLTQQFHMTIITGTHGQNRFDIHVMRVESHQNFGVDGEDFYDPLL